MHLNDYKNQDPAPINALLDLLNSKNHGVLKRLYLPKDLLLKSYWADRFGREKVEEYWINDHNDLGIMIVHTQFGLKMLEPNEVEEDDEEDEEEDGDEDDDEEEEDDNDENEEDDNEEEEEDYDEEDILDVEEHLDKEHGRT